MLHDKIEINYVAVQQLMRGSAQFTLKHMFPQRKETLKMYKIQKQYTFCVVTSKKILQKGLFGFTL